MITATAKVTGYHPATGLHLEEGETYTISKKQFSEDVFSTEDATFLAELEAAGKSDVGTDDADQEGGA